MAPEGRNFSWMAWLGLLGVIALGGFVFHRGELQPRRLTSDVEVHAAQLLAKAGYGWARLTIHGRVGELQGEAPSEDARVAAHDAARRLLTPYMGVPGVFSELDNRVRVKVVPTPVALVVAPPKAAAKPPAFPSTPSRDCLDALSSVMKTGTIRFKPKATDLPSTAKPAIRRMVQAVKRCDRWRLVVEGPPDASGNEAINRKLAQKRALSVVAALLLEGVPVGQLALQTEDGRLKTPGVDDPPSAKTTRRVEFQLVSPSAVSG